MANPFDAEDSKPDPFTEEDAKQSASVKAPTKAFTLTSKAKIISAEDSLANGDITPDEYRDIKANQSKVNNAPIVPVQTSNNAQPQTVEDIAANASNNMDPNTPFTNTAKMLFPRSMTTSNNGNILPTYDDAANAVKDVVSLSGRSASALTAGLAAAAKGQTVAGPDWEAGANALQSSMANPKGSNFVSSAIKDPVTNILGATPAPYILEGSKLGNMALGAVVNGGITALDQALDPSQKMNTPSIALASGLGVGTSLVSGVVSKFMHNAESTPLIESLNEIYDTKYMKTKDGMQYVNDVIEHIESPDGVHKMGGAYFDEATGSQIPNHEIVPQTPIEKTQKIKQFISNQASMNDVHVDPNSISDVDAANYFQRLKGMQAIKPHEASAPKEFIKPGTLKNVGFDAILGHLAFGPIGLLAGGLPLIERGMNATLNSGISGIQGMFRGLGTVVPHESTVVGNAATNTFNGLRSTMDSTRQDLKKIHGMVKDLQ
jgi:hypothetical protein